jgi:PAS domain S-box-containing protein
MPKITSPYGQLIKELYGLHQHPESMEAFKAKVGKIEHVLTTIDARFTAIAESTPDAVFICNREGNVIFWNAGATRIFGYTAQEMLGQSFMRLITERNKPRVQVVMDKLAREGPALFTGKTRDDFVVRKGGVEFPVEASNSFWRIGDDVFYGAILRDITQRVQAQEALRESEERYRAIVETATDAIVTINRKGTIVFWNSAAQAIFGYSADEAIGKPFEIILLERYKEPMWGWMEYIFSTDSFDLPMGAIEGPGKRKDGTEVPLEISISFWKSAHEYFSTAILRDISERKAAEEQLKIQAQNLEESNAALKVLLERRDADKAELEQKMLSNIKNLLVPYVDKLKIGKLEERQRSLVSIIETNLSEIISPFSHKLVSKFYNLTPSEIQVAGLVRDGRNSKEIAEIMNSSTRAVDFHRTSIRKKLGLSHQQVNLRSYLLNNF